jgi:hypothetical protein
MYRGNLQPTVLVETRHPSFYHHIALTSDPVGSCGSEKVFVKKMHGIPKK